MNNIYPITYVLSAERADADANANFAASEQLDARLEELGASYKVVDGCFKGVFETSFVVIGLKAKIILGLLQEFNQDSALRLECDRHAISITKDGSVFDLGQWVAVTEAEAKACNSYTFDPETKQYFIIK